MLPTPPKVTELPARSTTEAHVEPTGPDGATLPVPSTGQGRIVRARLKKAISWRHGGPATGATILTYHRVGGGSSDERDLTPEAFAEQLDVLVDHDIVGLDTALDRLAAGDRRPTVVLTFDDGFADIHAHAWPRLRERGFPFTVYLASAYVGTTMRWEGSTARSTGRGLTWDQLDEMAASGLCTIGNHTHTHARPEALTPEELDVCSDAIENYLGRSPQHFAYPWGVPVQEMEPALRTRFRSAVTGVLGRNLPGCDPMTLCRVPVRRSDPIEFVRAKLTGNLWPERAYDVLVRTAKRLGARA